MPKRRKPDVIAAEMEVLRSTVTEVAEIEDPSDDDIARSDSALDEFETLQSDLDGYAEGGDNSARRETEVSRSARRGPEVSISKDPFEILRGSTQHMGEREITRALVDSNLKAMEAYEMPDGYDGSFEKLIKRHGKDTSWSRNMLARN